MVEPDASREFQLPPKEYPEAPYIALPKPQSLDVPLGRALGGRFSCRQFEDVALGEAKLGEVLHATRALSKG